MSDLLENCGSSAEILEEHMCWLCGTQFEQKCDLDQHSQNNCNHIPKSMPEEVNLSLLYEETSNVIDPAKIAKAHACSFCCRSFSRKDHLKRHLNTCQLFGNAVKEKKAEPILVSKHKCELCDKMFTRRDHLYRHLNTVCAKPDVNMYSYVCFICGKRFLLKEKLTRHLTSSVLHAKKLLNCILCNVTFFRKDKLQHHLQKHFISKQEESKCQSCHIQFNNPKDLCFHVTQGAETYENPTNLCCMYRVTERKIYICFLCGTWTLKKKDLKTHILVRHIQNDEITANNQNAIQQSDTLSGYTQPEPLFCDICTYVVFGKESLILHKKSHITEDNSIAVDNNRT